MPNIHSHTSLPYLLAAHGRKHAEFVAHNLSKAYPAQIVEIETNPEKRKPNNMVTVSLRLEGASNLSTLEVPVATSRYVRLPLQVGDWGILMPSDYSIQTLIGAQGVTPNLHYPVTDLCSLVFVPVSRFSKNQNDPKDKMVWPDCDPDTLFLSGEKNGVQIQNLWDGDAKISLTKDEASLNFKNASVTLKEDSLKASLFNSTITLDKSSLSLKFGSAEIVIKDGTINLTGQISINGQPYLSHTHSNGNMGSPTGPVLS